MTADITTMDPVCCRDCSRLYYLRRNNVPSRQFWTADMVMADGCHGPVTAETGSLATSGLSLPHYCTLFAPAMEAA